MKLTNTVDGKGMAVEFVGEVENEVAQVALLVSFLAVTEGEGGARVGLVWSRPTLLALREAALRRVRGIEGTQEARALGVVTGITAYVSPIKQRERARLTGKALAALTRNLHRVSPVARVVEEGARKRPAKKGKRGKR
jgi:hypothetical protein